MQNTTRLESGQGRSSRHAPWISVLGAEPTPGETGRGHRHGARDPVYEPGTPGTSDPTRHALKIGDVDDFELRWEDRPDGGDKDFKTTP